MQYLWHQSMQILTSVDPFSQQVHQSKYIDSFRVTPVAYNDCLKHSSVTQNGW